MNAIPPHRFDLKGSNVGGVPGSLIVGRQYHASFYNFIRQKTGRERATDWDIDRLVEASFAECLRPTKLANEHSSGSDFLVRTMMGVMQKTTANQIRYRNGKTLAWKYAIAGIEDYTGSGEWNGARCANVAQRVAAEREISGIMHRCACHVENMTEEESQRFTAACTDALFNDEECRVQ